MRVVVSDPPPGDVAMLLERRRRLGIDRFDEVWEGVLHVNGIPHSRHAFVVPQVMALLGPLARDAGLIPLFGCNVGEADDYRAPDGALQRPGPYRLYYRSAALVLEVVAAGDETWDKLDFYAAHGVEELLIVDPQERAARTPPRGARTPPRGACPPQRGVHWLALAEDGEYRPVARSAVVDLGPTGLAERIEWPPLDE